MDRSHRSHSLFRINSFIYSPIFRLRMLPSLYPTDTDLLWNLEDFQHVYILICYLPNIDLKPTICQLEKRGKGHTKKEEKTI